MSELVNALRDFAAESEHTELMRAAADLIEKQDRLLGLYRRHKELSEKYHSQPSINAKKRYAAKTIDEFQEILEQIKKEETDG